MLVGDLYDQKKIVKVCICLLIIISTAYLGIAKFLKKDTNVYGNSNEVKKYTSNLPFKFSEIKETTFENKEFNIKNYGAKNGEAYLKDYKNNLIITDYTYLRDYLRPYMVYLKVCTSILIDRPTIKNSANLCTNITEAKDVIIRNTKVYNELYAQR